MVFIDSSSRFFHDKLTTQIQIIVNSSFIIRVKTIDKEEKSWKKNSDLACHVADPRSQFGSNPHLVLHSFS